MVQRVRFVYAPVGEKPQIFKLRSSRPSGARGSIIFSEFDNNHNTIAMGILIAAEAELNSAWVGHGIRQQNQRDSPWDIFRSKDPAFPRNSL